MARDSIPVPSSQQSRQQQSTRQAVNQAARDQQPPWRSSLDLVWSYSRSQAFYGDNLGTSPSFVDRHWAGPTRRDENGQLIEDSLDEYDEDEDGSEYLEEYSGTEADSAEENDNDETAAGAMEWEGEQLPRNALSSGSNSGMNGRRRSGGGGRSSRRRNSNSKRNSTSSGPRDRRISRLEDEESLDEERSRSRSRSPKRLGSGGNLRRDQHKEGSYLNPNRTNSYSSSSDSNSNYSNKRNSKDLNSNSIANENTPLLSTSGRKGSNGFLSANRRSISGTSSTGSSGYKSSLRLQYGQGTSTFLQSWFNTLNALVGVGILALPLAFSYSGWIGGTVLFLICGGLTNYTGKVLAKIMSKEPGLKTYSDIGAYAFGANARLVVSLLFCLELWAVSVALIILFGDSVYAMFGGYLTPAAFKAIGLAIILPTIFLPLNLLSPVSVIGIVSTFTLFGVVLLDGLIKKEAPGSLWQPATTHLLPEWSRFPLSFGLIMSGFSSHPIIPSLYKDMRDPRKFSKMLNLAYVGATIIYLSMGMVGYAMFGYKVSGEITQDLSRTPGYPHFLNKMAIWLIALNPLTKFALATRPINTTFESLFGLEALFIPPDSNFKKNSNFSGGRMANADENGVTNPDVNLETEQANGIGNASGSNITGETTPTPTQQNDNPLAGSAIALRSAERTKAWSPRFKLACRLGLRLLIAGLITVTAIVLPGFEKVMAFLGAFLASSTCVFGPLLANLKLFHSSMSRTRIAIDVFVLAAVFCFAVIGTVWTFMSFD